ncbi:hypothetical protein M3175_17145 [Robertmurraya korlensis]|uniref:hypothetical protein n=1 Tax=Robertmurraya korlensis TaxID=519977 RepID=UPI002041768E|nr:hypothetical protein [Robertmurraya korlensis]MCM3602462.1 hypothetical protein [Robertmurraya korlensis]
MKTALKSQRTVAIDPLNHQRINQFRNKKIASRFDFTMIFANVASVDVLGLDDKGVVQLDPTNPKHKELRDRWLED